MKPNHPQNRACTVIQNARCKATSVELKTENQSPEWCLKNVFEYRWFCNISFFKTLTMLQLFEHEATKSISKRVRYLTKRGYKSEESLFGEESSWRRLKRRDFFVRRETRRGVGVGILGDQWQERRWEKRGFGAMGLLQDVLSGRQECRKTEREEPDRQYFFLISSK